MKACRSLTNVVVVRFGNAWRIISEGRTKQTCCGRVLLVVKQWCHLGDPPRQPLQSDSGRCLNKRPSPALPHRKSGLVSGGGALVSTTTGGSFVEMLRKRMVLMTLGALRLTGLEATLAVPVQTGAATGYWLATEGTSITESQQTFAQMSLTPKTVGAYTEISDKLLKQSSASAEMIVTRDLAAVLAVAADAAGLVGSGASGEPTGIINTSGIGSVTGTSLDYDKALEFQSDVLGQNALISRDACGYITTTAVAKLLATGIALPLSTRRCGKAIWRRAPWPASRRIRRNRCRPATCSSAISASW